MKLFFILLAYFFSFTFLQAQDTLVTKSILDLDTKEVSISDPIYLNNKIIFFTSNPNGLKMIFLDTLGNQIEKKNINIQGGGAIQFAEFTNIIINSKGNIVLLATQAYQNGQSGVLIELTSNGNIVSQINTKERRDFNRMLSFFESKLSYTLLGLTHKDLDTNDICGVSTPIPATLFIKKNGEIDSLRFESGLNYIQGSNDSTIIAFYDGILAETNTITGETKVLKTNYQSFERAGVYSAIRLKNNKWFAVGEAYDSLKSKIGSGYYAVYDDDLNKIWSNRIITNEPLPKNLNNIFYKAQQSPINDDLLLFEGLSWWEDDRTMSLKNVSPDGKVLWRRSDTLADIGIPTEIKKNKTDYYSQFCYLPNGNMCALVISLYKNYTNSFNAYRYVRFVKFTNAGQNSAILYKSTTSTSNEIVGTTIKIFPNPFNESTRIEAQIGEEHNNLTFNLFDTNGRMVRSENFVGKTLDFQRNGLQNGFYFYEIKSDNKRLGTGKLVVF